jgi:hypothetical protein
MSFRSERFNKGFLSLDGLAESIDPAKSRIFSDRGEGEERICRAVDREDELDAERDLELDNQRFVLLMVAEGMLVLCAADRLVPVLEQVVANGANRQESIWRLAVKRRVNKHSSKRFYDRGVKALLTFFSPNGINGETHLEKP